MGLTVERYPGLYIPRKAIVTHKIPGRSGNLSQWDGSYEDYTVPYQCWFKSDPTGAQLRKVAAWLAGAPAGPRLEDSYDPDVYRLATYEGGADVENIRNRYGRFDVVFRVDPRKFLKSGDNVPNFTGSGILNNPTKNDAKPLIEIDTNGSLGGVIRINDYSVNLFFNGLPATTVYIDTDIREAWYLVDGTQVSCNQVIESPNWPRITPGRNDISIAGVGIDAVRIYPRWWQV